MSDVVERVACPVCRWIGCEQCEGEGWVWQVPNHLDEVEVRRQMDMILMGYALNNLHSSALHFVAEMRGPIGDGNVVTYGFLGYPHSSAATADAVKLFWASQPQHPPVKT